MIDENDPWHNILKTIQKHYHIGPYSFFDAEQEIMAALAEEIRVEIDNEILQKIKEYMMK